MGIGIAPLIGACRDNCHFEFKKTYAISQFIYFMGFYGILRGAVCAGWTLSGRLANKSPAQIANCHATLIAIWRN